MLILAGSRACLPTPQSFLTISSCGWKKWRTNRTEKFLAEVAFCLKQKISSSLVAGDEVIYSTCSGWLTSGLNAVCWRNSCCGISSGSPLTTVIKVSSFSYVLCCWRQIRSRHRKMRRCVEELKFPVIESTLYCPNEQFNSSVNNPQETGGHVHGCRRTGENGHQSVTGPWLMRTSPQLGV